MSFRQRSLASGLRFPDNKESTHLIKAWHPSAMKKILVIDDEKEICRSIKGILGDEGYVVDTALTPEEALETFSKKLPDLVLLDVWFGKSSWDGLYLLDQIKQQYPMLPVIMISGHGTFEMAVQAIKKGAYDFIEKPFEAERLLLSVQRGLETSQLRAENAVYRQEANQCKRWPFPLDAALRKVVATDARVLFIGPMGTGKKSLAQEIHLLSPRSHGPFVVLNSHVLNTLKDEDLFGVERDDVVEKQSLLEYAQGGSIVLTNVHALKRSLQAVFARIFESSSFVRTGSRRQVPLSVRFFLTARPEIETSSQDFHREFYDRVMIKTFHTQALRDKASSIVTWAELFLDMLSSDIDGQKKHFSKEAMRIIQSYPWPGNLRELYNVIEKIVLTLDQETIAPEHLPKDIVGMLTSFSDDIFAFPLQKARTLFEYHYLSAQLAAADGNVSHAAQVIGMERSALHRKIKNLKIKYQSQAS